MPAFDDDLKLDRTRLEDSFMVFMLAFLATTQLPVCIGSPDVRRPMALPELTQF